MKLRYIALSALAFTLTLAAQQTKTPEKSTKDDLIIAFKDYQLAAIQAQTADQNAEAAKQNVLNTIETARKTMGLDKTWDYNFNTNTFVQTPPTSAPKPVTTQTPAQTPKK